MSLPILVVDDNVDAGETMARLLTAWGYAADFAANGHDGLELLKKKPYGIAIIDYRMPDMNGVEFFRTMREVRPDTAAIILTGYTTIDVVYPAIEAGVLHVMSKPADLQQLLPIIEEHLGGGAERLPHVRSTSDREQDWANS